MTHFMSPALSKDRLSPSSPRTILMCASMEEEVLGRLSVPTAAHLVSFFRKKKGGLKKKSFVTSCSFYSANSRILSVYPIGKFA